MKYTSLFSAVAVAVAMSTQAFADRTNDVGQATFDEAKYGNGGPISGLNLTPEWSVQSEDASEIITAPLSTLDSEGYTGNNRLLKLNTEGQELVWNPGTVQQPEALIEMKVKLVASDTEPTMPADTSVHAAVFLKVADESSPSPSDGLYAYTANGWTQLNTTNMVRAATGDNTATGFIANGSTVALRVLMDYGSQKATYEGALITGDTVGPYVILGSDLGMANASTAQGQTLQSIAFKGTGGVDDLFVKEIEARNTSANIYLRVGENWDDFGDGTVDTEDSSGTYTGIIENFVSMKGNKDVSIKVYDEDNPADPTASFVTELSSDVITENGDDATVTISCNDYNGFVAGEDYYVHITFVDPAPTTYPVTFVSAGTTFFTTNVVASTPVVAPDPAPTNPGNDFGGWYTDDGTFQSAYDFTTPVTGSLTLYAKWTETPSVTGVEFGTFAIVDDGTAEFTAFSVSGTTATATLQAKIVSTGASTATDKKLYVKYTTTLGGSIYSYAEATVTAQTAGDPGSVSVSFTLPAGDAAFFVGFTNANE